MQLELDFHMPHKIMYLAAYFKRPSIIEEISLQLVMIAVRELFGNIVSIYPGCQESV